MAHGRSRYPSERFDKPQSIFAGNELVDVGWRRSPAVRLVRTVCCSFKKEWHRHTEDISHLLQSAGAHSVHALLIFLHLLNLIPSALPCFSWLRLSMKRRMRTRLPSKRRWGSGVSSWASSFRIRLGLFPSPHPSPPLLQISSDPEAIWLLDFARVAQWVRRTRMPVM